MFISISFRYCVFFVEHLNSFSNFVGVLWRRVGITLLTGVIIGAVGYWSPPPLKGTKSEYHKFSDNFHINLFFPSINLHVKIFSKILLIVFMNRVKFSLISLGLEDVNNRSLLSIILLFLLKIFICPHQQAPLSTNNAWLLSNKYGPLFKTFRVWITKLFAYD